MFTHKQVQIAYSSFMLFLCIVAACFIVYYFRAERKTLLVEDWNESTLSVNIEYHDKVYPLKFVNEKGDRATYTTIGSGRFITYTLDTSEYPGSTWYITCKRKAAGFNYSVY